MCFKCLHVNTCCCCGCSLRTGVLIIGWVSLVVYTVVFLYSLVVIIKKESDEDREIKCAEKCLKDPDIKERIEWLQCKHDCENTEKYHYIVSVYLNSWSSLLCLAISVGLLIAVYAVVPILLPVYVYVQVTDLIVYTFLNAILHVVYKTPTLYIVGAVFFTLLWWALKIYCCMVVYSLYRTMVNSDEYPVRGGPEVLPPPGPYYYPQQVTPQ